MSLADVDTALTGRGLRRPSVRMVRDGEVIDPGAWTRTVRTGAVTVDDAIDPARVLDLYAGGATIVLQSLQRWWEPVARFCAELETTLTHAVQANAYLTGPGAAGLTPHHDTHDVFVLQLHGTKRWVVREPLVEAPLRRHRSEPSTAASQPVMFETELRPGACLYLPRGVIHSARSQETSSLHLTIGVLATTAADVVRRIATFAGEVPGLRRSLPAGWAADPVDAERIVKEIVDELGAFVSTIDTMELTGRIVDGFVSSRRPLPGGRLLDLERATTLDDESVVVCRHGAIVATDTVGSHLVVRAHDRTVELPLALEAPVAMVLDGRPHVVGDLSTWLDEASRLVLVRRLVREGLVRVVVDDA